MQNETLRLCIKGVSTQDLSRSGLYLLNSVGMERIMFQKINSEC